MVSSSTDPALARAITQHFPAAQSAGSFFPLSGLTGQSGRVTVGDKIVLARRQHPINAIPGVDRRREYHILRQLANSGLVPAVQGFSEGWLLLEWQPGRALNPQQFLQQLEALIPVIARLHSQPLSGYRLSLLRLLEQYWLLSHPSRRHCGWLRALKRLQQQGEPKPLRLALLHMDIHAGNVIAQQPEDYGSSGEILKRHANAEAGNRPPLRLIDWEYASDGDVALELAALVAGNPLSGPQQARLITAYARLQQIDAARLARQIERWQPWLRLLLASWYELRWQQTQEKSFFTLAAEAWQRVLSEQR